jgi:hypothetical protein
MELGAIGQEGLAIRVDWLGEEASGLPRFIHLLPPAAFRLMAKHNEVLKAQDSRAFLLVQFPDHGPVASL